jgi:adenylate kinase
MILIFLGAPGSGKDTQANLLKDKYDFKVISTGQLFRDAIDSGSELGNKIKKKYDQGFLMTDKEVKLVLEDYFQNNTPDRLVLTGVVRTFDQIEIIDEILKGVGQEINKVVYFNISDETVVERISNRLVCDIDNSIIYHKIFNPPPAENECTKIGGKLIQRNDDKEEVVRQRLIEFHGKSEKVLEEYKNRDLLLEIDAQPSIGTIHENLISQLGLD